MKTISLPDGTPVPVLGQGTWKMGEDERDAKKEADALRLGIDLGMTLLDTAEMYADGRSEEVVAAAIKGQRERVFLVNKVYPHNASRKGLPAACERSLRRLGTDLIDLYLLRWRGSVPLAERSRLLKACAQPARSAREACPTSTWMIWRNPAAAWMRA